MAKEHRYAVDDKHHIGGESISDSRARDIIQMRMGLKVKQIHSETYKYKKRNSVYLCKRQIETSDPECGGTAGLAGLAGIRGTD